MSLLSSNLSIFTHSLSSVTPPVPMTKMMTYLTVVTVTVTVLTTDLCLRRHCTRFWSRPSQSTPNPLRWVFTTIEHAAPVLQVFSSVSYTIRTCRVKTGYSFSCRVRICFYACVPIFTYDGGEFHRWSLHSRYHEVD